MPEPGDGEQTYTKDELESAIQEANKGLEANRNEVLAELKEAKERLAKLKGIDPDEYKSLQTTVAELQQQQKAEKAGITSDQLQKMRADVEADVVKRFTGMPVSELAERIPAVGELANDNRGLRLDSVVKAEMGKAGVRSERIDALFRLAADKFDLTDDGRPMLRESPGMEVGKFVAEDLKKEYPEFYNGSGSSGGGSSKSAGGAGGRTVITAGDNDAFIANLDKIASGEVEMSGS